LVALSFRCFAIWVLALPLLFSFVTTQSVFSILVPREKYSSRADTSWSEQTEGCDYHEHKRISFNYEVVFLRHGLYRELT
jgi:hypothetical protein